MILRLWFVFCGEMYCKCSTPMVLCSGGGLHMNKTISISIRVSEKDLNKLKEAAEIESYSSYSEFIRRTALIEADGAIEKERTKAKGYKEERLEN